MRKKFILILLSAFLFEISQAESCPSELKEGEHALVTIDLENLGTKSYGPLIISPGLTLKNLTGTEESLTVGMRKSLNNNSLRFLFLNYE